MLPYCYVWRSSSVLRSRLRAWSLLTVGQQLRLHICVHVPLSLRFVLQMAAPISRAPPIPKGKQTVIKGPWTEEEDAKVRQLVMELGTKKWCVVAAACSCRGCQLLLIPSCTRSVGSSAVFRDMCLYR